jgi:hypothetical protein
MNVFIGGTVVASACMNENRRHVNGVLSLGSLATAKEPVMGSIHD